jgi:hypothetical protein
MRTLIEDSLLQQRWLIGLWIITRCISFYGDALIRFTMLCNDIYEASVGIERKTSRETYA